ncbi:unnamed protein product [Hydatigera taeniaeformis]|uniref:FHA domain-containing protein n=1 Tax=Hydatigena taeniaeformis TaxID=6205 RepID=A0A0R3WYU0_HYDTA|nr:unnamed protein product [Hydatigera taeniaeformis]
MQYDVGCVADDQRVYSGCIVNNECKNFSIAFDWNGRLLVNDNGELSSNSNVMIVPGRGVGKKDDVVIVVMPHFLQPPVATTVAPPLPFPPAIPVDGIHGGAIVGGAGEGSLFVPCKLNNSSICDLASSNSTISTKLPQKGGGS